VRTAALRPYPWGVSSLAVNTAMLSLGKFAVERAAGALSDGTPFSLPEDAEPPEPLDVPPDTRDATVYLTLPARQSGTLEFVQRNGGKSAAQIIARQVVDEEDVYDAFAAERVAEPIEVAKLNLRYGITREQTDGRVCLGVARIREVTNGAVILDDRYIPAALDVRAATRIHGFLNDIIGRAEQRVEELGLRAVEATEGGAETFASFLLLQALNRWCPMLQHLESLPRVHPERLFEQLVGFAGEVATLVRPERKPPPFPKYDHENLQLTFEPVFDLLQSMLSAVFDRSAIQMPLDVVGPGSYKSTIVDHGLYKEGFFYLAVNAAVPLEEIRGRFPAVAKIGAVTKMRQIVESALPGVPLRHTPTPPPQLRVLPGYVYFELDRSVRDWKDFATAPALGLHVAGDWPQLRLELWCVKRPGR
jgi:type VI secretion system protein ImpJ